MNEMTPAPQPKENALNVTVPSGAGLRAKQWLLRLLTDLYSQYGSQMWDSPQLTGIMGFLNMPIPQLASIRKAISAFKESGPRVLEDKLQISDDDAGIMLGLFYDYVIVGFKEVLYIDLEAE